MFKLFQVDIEMLTKIKFEWMYQKHIDTLVVDSWYYFQFEYYIKLLNKRIKEENERHEEQEKKQQGNYNTNSFNPNSVLNKLSSGSNFAKPRF